MKKFWALLDRYVKFIYPTDKIYGEDPKQYELKESEYNKQLLDKSRRKLREVISNKKKAS